MSSVQEILEEYQKDHLLFAEKAAELAGSPQNIDDFKSSGIIDLLKPLLFDKISDIQDSAALALGRLVYYSYDIAKEIIDHDFLPKIVLSLEEDSKFSKKAGIFFLRTITNRESEHRQAVVDSGALKVLVLNCQGDIDSVIKENAALALGNIASHSTLLAINVIEAGTIEVLDHWLDESDFYLSSIAIKTFSEIAKNSAELAQKLVDSKIVQRLPQLINNSYPNLKLSACICLAQIAKHSIELAETVVQAGIFPKIFDLLKDEDILIRKWAAMCIREIVKHNFQLSKLVVDAGGVTHIIDYINETKGDTTYPGIMSLAFIGAFDGNLAMRIIDEKCILPLKNVLQSESEDFIKAASAWGLGQIGRHSPDHANALAELYVPSCLLNTYIDEQSSLDLKSKSKRALKLILKMCTNLPTLEELLQLAPPIILKHVINQLAKILSSDLEAKNAFAQRGGLQKIQEINAAPESDLGRNRDIIIALYKPNISN